MQYKTCENTLLNPIVERINSFLTDDLLIEVSEEGSDECMHSMALSFHTSIIALCGGVNGWFIMSYDETILNAIANKFVYGKIEENEKEDMIASVADEVTNIIIGNVLSYFVKDGLETKITPPIGILNAEEISNIKQRETIARIVKTEYGKIFVAISADEISF